VQDRRIWSVLLFGDVLEESGPDELLDPGIGIGVVGEAETLRHPVERKDRHDHANHQHIPPQPAIWWVRLTAPSRHPPCGPIGAQAPTTIASIL
jgi:hypothetical protein